ncbi:MAG: 4Fe-4S dicluster domain-containing protein, partial [Lachnospiraceae bacterium]|nr:4Fe-4S dicluster domain-containing protein [Lachnospiraceae bacterium]
AAFRKLDKEKSDAYWGLRWIWDHPAVTVVLSGMNEPSQVKENVRIASESLPDTLTKKEKSAYRLVKKRLQAKLAVGCTGCGYCQPCPQGVDIPNCFSALNNSHIEGWFTGFREYLMCTSFRKKKTNAGLCIECGACEKRCPQHLAIRRELKRVRRSFETPVFGVVNLVAGWMMKY